jgi:hypothetical protein
VTRAAAIVSAAAVALAGAVGTACAASLPLATWHLWGGKQTLTKGTCTLTGTAATTDTYVDESQDGNDYSAATTMRVGAGSGARRWTFVRFDLSSCAVPATGGADTATLKLRITTAPSSNRTLTVAPVLTSWASSLSWSPAQSLGYGPATTTFTTGTTSNVTVNIPVTIDVDALIKSATANYGWRITDGGAGSAATTFASANNATAANRPQLVVNYEK